MGSFLLGEGSLLLLFTSLKRTMGLLLLSIFTYVSADADAQIPISVPGLPTPALDTPIVTPALRSPIVTQALNTPIITSALRPPPVVQPAGQDGVALRSQLFHPASLGGGVYYTSNPYTPNTVYYTPNTAFKKTPEDLTKLIKAYSDLSPDTKKIISERSQCQDWQKQAIVEFFENNLSVGCVKAFMQEILYENGCDQDYDYNTNTKSAETDQVQTKRRYN